MERFLVLNKLMTVDDDDLGYNKDVKLFGE